MRRYYLAPIIGDGQSTETVYRVQLPRVNHSAVIPSNAATGAPLFSWALCVVEAPDHGAMLADAALTALPNLGLDQALDQISTSQRNALFAALDGKGINRVGLTQASTMRDVLRRIGRYLEAAFDESRNTVV